MFLEPKFWLAISFFTFVALMIKYALPLIIKMIDDKSKQIAKDIADARNAKEEAENLLAEAKKYSEESKKYCQKLIDDAQNEAAKILADSQKSLEDEINKKTDLAKERIKNEEEKTIREIKSNIIDAAIKNVAKKAANNSEKDAAELVERAVGGLT
jgi:F-type H+-transporting ATPase subunit b